MVEGKMSKYLFLIASLLSIILQQGCGEDVAGVRENAYDPENPWGVTITKFDTLTTDRNNDYPSLSFDGTKIAYTKSYNRISRIYVKHLAICTDVELKLKEDDVNETNPQWSPTEDKIAYIRYSNYTNSNIYVREYPGDNSVQLTQGGKCTVGSIFWSQDGARIAYVQDDSLKIIDATDGSVLKELSLKDMEKQIGSSILKITDWSPDESKLIVITLNRRAYIFDICTNSVEPLPINENSEYFKCFYGIWSTMSRFLYVIYKYDRYELRTMNDHGEENAVILTNNMYDHASQIDCLDLLNISDKKSLLLFRGSVEFTLAEYDICLMEMTWK